jgi:hypothetical protein
MKRFCLPLFFLATATFLPAAVPPPDKLLPADTMVVVSVPDWSNARKVSERGPMLQLWNDPAIKPFKDKFLGKLKSDLIEPLEREFGAKLSDYTGLLEGQYTFAITEKGPTEKEPGLLVLIDTGSKSETLKTNLANLKKTWVDKGKKIKNEKIRDQEFTTFIFSSDDFSKVMDKLFPSDDEGFEKLEEPKEPKKPKTVEWTVGQSGSLFILSDTPRQIEQVLVRQSGGSAPSLSEQANFASNYGRLFRNAMAYGWVDIKTIIAKALKEDKEEGEKKKRAFDPSALLKATGISGLQSLALNVEQSAEGTMVNFNANIPESQRQGLFKILSFSAKEAAPPPSIPADAVKFGRFRFDLGQAWTSLEKMVTEMSPAAAGTFKLIIDSAGKDKDPDFSLRKSVLENLGDDIITYQKNPKSPTLAELGSPPSLTLIASPRPEQFAAGLKALAGTILPQQSKLKEREFLGRKVYTVNLPTERGQRGAPAKKDRTLSFTASGAYVAIATDPAILEEYLRGTPEKALRDLSGLAATADKVGGMGTGLFGMENQKETMRVQFETLRKESGSIANLLGSTPLAGRLGMKDDKNKFKEWFDFSLLPPYDQIAKYFHLSVYSGSVTAEGMQFKIFGPTPPGLK